MLNEVILTILNQSSNRPITERADSATVKSYLKTELENNGIVIPFEYAIIDRNGNIVYKSSSYNENTNKKTIKFDAKDARFIKSIDNVKLCYERKGGGIVGFVGNLQCDFRPPFGGMFFVKKVFEEETDFKTGACTQDGP